MSGFRIISPQKKSAELIASLRKLYQKGTDFYLRQKKEIGKKVREWQENRFRTLVLVPTAKQVRAAIVGCRKQELVIKALEKSEAQDWTAQDPQTDFRLTTVLSKLKDRGHLPRNAILILPDVMVTILRLPVSPAKLRPYDEMHEMIRFEMEFLISEKMLARPLGMLLVERGYIKREEIGSIVQKLEARRVKTAVGTASTLPDRFGNLAVELGYCSPNAIQECISLQERFRRSPLDLRCAWRPLSDQHPEEGMFPWVAAALLNETVEEWKKRFEAQGIHVESIYPLSFCQAGFIAKFKNQNKTAVAELFDGSGTLAVFDQGKLEKLGHFWANERPYLEDMTDEIRSLENFSQLLVAGDPATLEKIAPQLDIRIRERCLSLKEALPNFIEDPETVAMLGAACDFFKVNRSGIPLPIPVTQPAPVWYKNRRFLGRLTLGMSAAFLLLMETIFGFRFGIEKHLHTKAEEKLHMMEEKILKANQNLEEIKTFEKGLEAMNQELEMYKRKSIFLENSIARRESLIPAFLDLVAESVNEEIVVNRILEREGGIILMSGWGLNEKTIQAFARDLSRKLVFWNLKISGLEIREGKGKLGLIGYAYDFEIYDAKTSETDGVMKP